MQLFINQTSKSWSKLDKIAIISWGQHIHKCKSLALVTRWKQIDDKVAAWLAKKYSTCTTECGLYFATLHAQRIHLERLSHSADERSLLRMRSFKIDMRRYPKRQDRITYIVPARWEEAETSLSLTKEYPSGDSLQRLLMARQNVTHVSISPVMRTIFIEQQKLYTGHQSS
jgi:hypothetical protein